MPKLDVEFEEITETEELTRKERSGLSITGNYRQTRLIMACDTALAERVMARAAGHEPDNSHIASRDGASASCPW